MAEPEPSQNKKKEVAPPKATDWLIFFIIVGLLVWGAFAIFGGGDNKNEATKNTATVQQTKSEHKPKTTAAKQTMSEGDAEKFCQDDNLTPILHGNSQYDDVSMIDVWNYNDKYTDYGGYDKSGYPIMMLTWNGKKDGNTLGFSCFVSGPKDRPTLHYLGMGGEAMRGSIDFDTYDKNGKLDQ